MMDGNLRKTIWEPRACHTVDEFGWVGLGSLTDRRKSVGTEDGGEIGDDTLQESATLPYAMADGKGKDGGRQRPLPSAADGKRLRQSRLR